MADAEDDARFRAIPRATIEPAGGCVGRRRRAASVLQGFAAPRIPDVDRFGR
jgi:hypothetical protein